MNLVGSVVLGFDHLCIVPRWTTWSPGYRSMTWPLSSWRRRWPEVTVTMSRERVRWNWEVADGAVGEVGMRRKGGRDGMGRGKGG